MWTNIWNSLLDKVTVDKRAKTTKMFIRREIDRTNTHRDNPEGFEKTKQFTGLAHISLFGIYLSFGF